MQFDRSASIGGLCVTIFVRSTAVRDVYFSGVFQSISVFAVLLITFSAATAIGLTLAVLRRDGSLKVVRASWHDTISMNVTTALAWSCYFFALKWLEPSIANTLFSGIAPFTVIILNTLGISISRPTPSSFSQKLMQVGLLASLAALVLIVVFGFSGLGTVDKPTALLGTALALISGVLITVSLMYCKRLNERGASPEALLGTRFIGLIILAGSFLVTETTVENLPDLETAATLVPIATILIVAPVYLQQIGIARIGPLNAKIIATLGPVLVFFMQFFDDRIDWSLPTFCAICTYSIFALASNFAQRNVYIARV